MIATLCILLGMPCASTVAIPTLPVNDTIRIELKDQQGHSVFGAIEQTVQRREG